MNKMKRASMMVDISRALGAISGELGAVLAQKILEKRIDGDQLLNWLNSVESKATEEPIVMDVFCKHSDLFVPYLDRLSLNRLFSTNSQIYDCSRSITLPWPQLLLRVGSSISIKSVAFSSDGEWLACGAEDGIVRLWNRRNGTCTLLESHTGDVSCVSFSPDGKFLASVSQERPIHLWKLDDKSHVFLEGHNDAIMKIVFSPTGSFASGSCGGEVRLWDIVDGRCASTRSITTQCESVWSLAFSPDGATLAIGGDSICLWNLEAEEGSISSFRTIDTNGQDVESLAYSRDGIFLASAADRVVKIWRASDLSLVQGIRDHNIRDTSFSPNGNLLASGGDFGSGNVRLWNMNDRDADCFAVSPHVHLFDGAEEEEDGFPVCVRSVAFTTNGQSLASGGEDGNIFLWDTREFL
jgi:WD40 repeat protein